MFPCPGQIFTGSVFLLHFAAHHLLPRVQSEETELLSVLPLHCHLGGAGDVDAHGVGCVVFGVF